MLFLGLHLVMGFCLGQSLPFGVGKSKFQLSGAKSNLMANSDPAMRDQARNEDEMKAQSQLVHAETMKRSGEIRGALKGYLQALMYFEKVNQQSQQTGVLLEIGDLYELWEVPERAVEYYNRAMIKINAHKVKDFSINELNLKMAECYQKLEKYEKAEYFFSESLQHCKKLQNKTSYRFVLTHLSELYQQQNQTDKLLDVSLEILEIEKQAGDVHSYSKASNNVGFICKAKGEWARSMDYFSQAIEMEKVLEKPDAKTLISTYVNRASVYNQKGRYALAQSDLQAASRIAAKDNDYVQLADLHNFTAMIYYNTHDYQNAYRNCNQGVKYGQKSGSLDVQVRNYKTCALILEKLGDYKEAIDYQRLCSDLKDSIFLEEKRKSSETLLKRLNIERTEKELKLLLTDAEKSEIEYQKLRLEAEKKQKNLELLTKENALQEITFKTQSLEKEKALQHYQMVAQKQATEKKLEAMALQQKNAEFQMVLTKQELDKRSKQSKIKLLEQDKQLLEKNKKLQMSKLESQTTREKYFKAIVILGSMALVGVVFGLFQIRNTNSSLKLKQAEVEQANSTLGELNQLIVNKNRSITDSINYARSIQESILPDRSLWNSVFPDSFIYFKPKDIVSGDFYFLTQARNKWFLAVSDCTGHGVPGAFMSLIGHNLLTRIIETQGISDPAEILHELDIQVNRTLKAQSKESRDGMEMALCVFDFEAGQMEFASSMLPLYGMADQGFFELKGSRYSIGGDNGSTAKTFKTHTLDLSQTSALYLCSDGYQDQLGGPDSRRFSSSRLKMLLNGIHQKPLVSQNKLIEFTMADWLSKEHQLDDLMVIGIQLHRNPDSGLPKV